MILTFLKPVSVSFFDLNFNSRVLLTAKVKNDDYGMMKEVLFRRFSKAIKEKSGSLSLPDLILIDGGKGQYSVSREVLNELGLHDLPILAVAKGLSLIHI